jgi:type IX secretion system PorP/SprF family membrane protein
MQKKLLFLILTFIVMGVLPVIAQQDAQLSQYMFNPLYINPATAGTDGTLKFQLHYRNQWSGYQTSLDGGGSLGTQIFTASMPLNGLRSGIGVHFVNDKTPSGAGYQDLKLSYSYQIGLGNGSIISLGARGGFHIKSFDNSFRPRESDDPLIDGLSGKISQTKPDYSVGVLYKASNYFVGASLNHINSPVYNFGITNIANNKAVQSLYVHGGYNYYLTDDIEISPTALFRTDFQTNVLEGGAILTYAEKYWVGGSYRLNDAGIIIAGISLLQNNSLKIGYSLDLTTTNGASAKAPTSHEILLSYSLPAPKLLSGKKTPVRTPRFRR